MSTSFAIPKLPFCNREAELQVITGLLTKPDCGLTGVLLSGNPGIGKTTLAERVINNARNSGYLVMSTAAEPQGSDISLHGIKNLIETAPNTEKDVFHARELMDFWAWVQSRVLLTDNPISRNLLAGGLDFFAKQSEKMVGRLDRMDPHLRFHKLLSNQEGAFVEYLTYLTDSGSALLVLDDFHWMDSSSIVAFKKLLTIKCHNPLFLLVVYRLYECTQNNSADNFVRNLRSQGFHDISLTPLPERALAASIRAAAPELNTRVIREVVDSAEGNPLLASEDVALRLLQGGKGSTDFQKTPDSRPVLQKLEELIYNRSRFLSKVASECLSIGACLGHTFSMQKIIEILGILSGRLGLKQESGIAGMIDVFTISSTVDEIEQLGLARTIEPAVPSTFRFSHPLVHEIVYQRISPSKRFTLHSCIAEALEREEEQGLPIHYGELGRHHRESRNYPHAFIAFLKAARDSCSSESYVHAGTQYNSAVVCLDLAVASGLVWRPALSTSLRPYLIIKLAECLHRAGEFSAARDACLAALKAASEMNLHLCAAEAKYWLGKVEYFIGTDTDAIRYYNQSIEIFQRSKTHGRTVRTLNALAASLIQIGSNSLAESVFNKALDLAVRIEKSQPRIAIDVYQNSSMILESTQATRWLKRGLSLAENTTWLRQLGMLWHNYGVEQFYLGHLEESRSAFQRARELLLQTMSFELVYTLNSLGVLKLINKNIGAAAHYFLQAERRIVANFDKIWITNNMAILEHYSGRTTNGIRLIEGVLPAIDEHSDPIIREKSYFNLGVLYFYARDFRQAKVYICRSKRRDTLYAKHLVYAMRYRLLSCVYKESGQPRKALRFKRLSGKLFASEHPEKWSFEKNEFMFCHLCAYH